MQPLACPICQRPRAAGSSRCPACGADLNDPDVLAAASGGAEAAAAGEELAPPGGLTSDRLLGVSMERLLAGDGLRRLAFVGAVVLVAFFLIPVAEGFGERRFAWAVKDGPRFALLFPAIAALVGVVVSLARPLPPWIGGAVLTALGATGVIVVIRALGPFAGAPETATPVFSAGLLVAGAALVVRVASPAAREARWALAVGAVVALAGLFVPVSPGWRTLPLELVFYVQEAELETASPFAATLDAFNRDPMVFFVACFNLLPLVLLPAAAAVAWPRPSGPWDRTLLVLRPLAWLVVLYVPLAIGLQLFNILGYNKPGRVFWHGGVGTVEDFTVAIMIGRARLLGLAAVFAYWAQFGLALASTRLRPIR